MHCILNMCVEITSRTDYGSTYHIQADRLLIIIFIALIVGFCMGKIK